jgi:hypothetical protein
VRMSFMGVHPLPVEATLCCACTVSSPLPGASEDIKSAVRLPSGDYKPGGREQGKARHSAAQQGIQSLAL